MYLSCCHSNIRVSAYTPINLCIKLYIFLFLKKLSNHSSNEYINTNIWILILYLQYLLYKLIYVFLFLQHLGININIHIYISIFMFLEYICLFLYILLYILVPSTPFLIRLFSLSLSFSPTAWVQRHRQRSVVVRQSGGSVCVFSE